MLSTTQASEFDNLVKTVMQYNASININAFKNAFSLLEKYNAVHWKTKKPFVEIDLILANMLADLNLDSATIIAALLYHPFIYSGLTEKEVEQVNSESKNILNNLKKFKEYEEKISSKEDLQKLVLAMTKDPRIIIFKMTKQLMYLRLANFIEPNHIKICADAAMEIYAPIAHKLGINKIKSELEDLAFKYLQPDTYEGLEEKITALEREDNLKTIKKIMEDELAKNEVNAVIFGRPKHIFSIYKKMQRKEKPFEEIYDLTGLRIICETKKECYEILGIIHSLWKPLPGEFDDYIAKPKPNMYQSLHTALIGPDKRVFEVQIRTKEMDKVAEYGYAAHWKYKGYKSDKKWEKKLAWVKQMMAWRQDLRKSSEFMDSLKSDFFEDEIFVFTPKRQVIELPQGSTALDFAYSIHTEIGHKCSKAKVNNKLVQLGYELHSGDTVEILTSENQEPKRDWITMVKTSKAKTKIRQKLQLKAIHKKEEQIKTLKSLVIKKLNDEDIRLAKCCLPIPGDEVLGYYTTKRKTIVHRTNCANAGKQKSSNRLISVAWDVKGNDKFLTEVRVEFQDTPGMLSELLKAFSNSNISIKSTDAKTIDSNKSRAIFTFDAKNVEEVAKLTDKLAKIKGVTFVERA